MELHLNSKLCAWECPLEQLVLAGKPDIRGSRSHSRSAAGPRRPAGSSAILGALVSISGVMNEPQGPAELNRQQQGAAGQTGPPTTLVRILTNTVGPDVDTATNKVSGP